jgi:WD40 repeat protein
MRVNTTRYLSFLCAAFLTLCSVGHAPAVPLSSQWIPLTTDSPDRVRSVIASEVEKVVGYATTDESDASNRLLMDEKEREDNASRETLAELENRFRQAKRTRDSASSSFSEKSAEYEDSRKNFQESGTALQNMESRIALCQKEIVSQQEHLKKYLRTEKQGEALVAVIYTQGIRDALYQLNRRADELSAPELANLMGTSIQSSTEVIGGVLSRDFIRSVTEGTAKPANEEPVRIQLDVTSSGTRYLRVKRYELYPFQEPAEMRKPTAEATEKSNVAIVSTFSDLERFLSQNGYQVTGLDTSRIRKLIDEVGRINRQQHETLNETIAAIRERIANQRGKISEATADRERETAKKARLEEATNRLGSELALIKERKERAETELTAIQSQLNEKKRLSETIILKSALQPSKGGQSPADASIEAIIDKLEEVKNDARVQHSRETMEVRDAQLTSLEQARGSTEARVTAVRLIALTNEGSNGVRVRVAFRVQTTIVSPRPEIAQEAKPAPGPDPKPKITPEPRPESTPEPAPEPTPEAVPETISKPAPEPGEEGWYLRQCRNRNQPITGFIFAPPLLRSAGATVRLPGHSADIRSIAFSPDGSLAASGDGAGRIILWETTTWRQWGVLNGQTSTVLSLGFSPNGCVLASGGSDSGILLWDVANRKRLAALIAAPGVTSVAFSSDGRHLAAGTDAGKSMLWDTGTRNRPRVFEGSGAIARVAFNPDGRLLATAGKNRSVTLWELSSGRSFRSFQAYDSDTRTLLFSPNGRFLMSGCQDGRILHWDTARGTLARTFLGHERAISALAISRDGQRLVSLEKIEKRVPSIQPVDILFWPFSRILKSPDSGSQQGAVIIVWDIRSGGILKRIPMDRGSEAMAVSPNGTYLLVGQEKELLVYRLE